MRLIKLGAATLNQTPLDWDGNARRVRAALRAAREARVGLLCMPELCLTGYGCEDMFLAQGVIAEAQRMLGELLPDTAGLTVAFGLPVLRRGGVYSAAAVASDGRLLGVAAKQHLAGDGIHYEPRWFKPWPAGERADLDLCGATVPFGDLVFEVGDVRFGFEICEDAWAADRPGAALARAAVDVILNPSASHFAFGKIDVRRRFVLEGSRAFGASYVYANLVGNESGRAIYDGGSMIASGGTLVAEGRRLSFHEQALVTAVVDVEATRIGHARVASFQPDSSLRAERLVRAPGVWPAVALEVTPPARESWESSPRLKEEELLRAIALALFDYLRKSRAAGFVVSSSGGCDSAAVVCLASLALRLAWRELGEGGVRARLAHIPAAAVCADEAALASALITTVYQATAHSSAVTRAAARTVAEVSGARHVELDVQPMVDAYVGAVSAVLGRTLDWGRDDVALQNIQARARAPGAWLIANVEQKLLLATSNRSEAALGYATMDGDTCGGIAPLTGIDKAFLRRWLAWLAEMGPAGLGPLPALRAVVIQASTPEMRPAAAAQTSEGDLMPFDVLDRIERLAIRDKLAPTDVLARMRAESPALPAATLAGWIERFFTLFARNQWKRERYAPSFHVDDENLDPRSWCRFPILSGGFARELHDLRRAAAEQRGGES